MSVKIFLSGLPGCGKTTLIKNILQKIKIPSTGFYTEEIRESGIRTGFSIRTLNGKEVILSSVSINSKFRVGKYKVNIEGIEDVAVPSIQTDSPDHIIVIDEIGKMECLSDKFREKVLEILNLPNPILATVPQKGTQFIESLKRRSGIKTIQITKENRNGLIEEILPLLKNLQNKTL